MKLEISIGTEFRVHHRTSYFTTVRVYSFILSSSMMIRFTIVSRTIIIFSCVEDAVYAVVNTNWKRFLTAKLVLFDLFASNAEFYKLLYRSHQMIRLI